MSLYRDEAIVLRTQKLGEADRIVTLLMRDRGRVRAVAKGVRKTSSRFGARLEPFMHIDVQLYEGRSLDTVTQAETLGAYGLQIAGDYPRYTSATAMLETAERLTETEREPALQQFILLAGGLRTLAAGTHDSGLVLDAYLLRSLAVAGWAPSFTDCARCGAPGPHRAFALASGGSVCPACRPPGSAAPHPETLLLLAALLSGDWAYANTSEQRRRREGSGLVAAYVQWHLERRVRSLSFLERDEVIDVARVENVHVQLPSEPADGSPLALPDLTAGGRPLMPVGRRRTRAAELAGVSRVAPVPPPPHPSGERPPSVPAELVPKHVAIVMDGNGRWANSRGLPRTAGHEMGEAALLDVVAGGIEAGVSHISAYAFSTENWKRSPDEVRFLMGFNRDVIRRRRDEMHAWGVRVRWAGRRPRLWRSVINELETAEELTKHNTVLTLTMCVNYGGRAEVADAAKQIAREVAAGRLDPERVDERTVARYLDEPDMPDVDMFLRTSGEQRTSNFLLWQSAYAELVFLDVLWPDVDRRTLWRAIEDYAKRDRRYGGAMDAAAEGS